MVEFENESELLNNIEILDTNNKINASVGIDPTDIRSLLHKLILSTKQKTRVSEMHLRLLSNLESFPYLTTANFHSEQMVPESLVNISDSDLQIMIKSNSVNFWTILCLLLEGFFASLVSSSDNLAGILNIIYDCIDYNSNFYLGTIRNKLIDNRPRDHITREICRFHPQQFDDESIFNIARNIRNQLTHEIQDVLDIQTQALYGPIPSREIIMNIKDNLFSQSSNFREERELITFCSLTYKNLFEFIDSCYKKKMSSKLRRERKIPI
ncbi:hypothetical protein GF312_13065 [Candidatus Poribacteria bacterium]|nr:hypothetical protein [Candidatus Poribacteria bacterium]